MKNKITWKNWEVCSDGSSCCREGIDENNIVWLAIWKIGKIEKNEYPELYVYSVKNRTGINIDIAKPFCPSDKDEAWKIVEKMCSGINIEFSYKQ